MQKCCTKMCKKLLVASNKILKESRILKGLHVSTDLITVAKRWFAENRDGRGLFSRAKRKRTFRRSHNCSFKRNFAACFCGFFRFFESKFSLKFPKKIAKVKSHVLSSSAYDGFSSQEIATEISRESFRWQSENSAGATQGRERRAGTQSQSRLSIDG